MATIHTKYEEFLKSLFMEDYDLFMIITIQTTKDRNIPHC